MQLRAQTLKINTSTLKCAQNIKCTKYFSKIIKCFHKWSHQNKVLQQDKIDTCILNNAYVSVLFFIGRFNDQPINLRKQLIKYSCFYFLIF